MSKVSPPPVRPKPWSWFIWTLLCALIFGLLASVWFLRRSLQETAVQLTGESDTPLVNAGLAKVRNGESAPAPATASLDPASPSASISDPVDPAMTAVVAGLQQLSGSDAQVTAESAAAWLLNFTNVVQKGVEVVPALNAFLAQEGVPSFSKEAAQALGFGSPRLAAIDALRQIEAPESIGTLKDLLRTTHEPKEVAIIASALEAASPGEFREQSLAAARAGLAANRRSENSNLDVAPFFEVLSHYGDVSVIQDLESALGRWDYYASIALASLPNDIGIPSLLKIADTASSNSGRVVALEMVAQVAADNPTAREFLVNQVKGNAIAPNLWPYLSGSLSGDQYYPVDSAITPYPNLQLLSDLKTTTVKAGNQRLYSLPGDSSVTAEGIQRRLALVDELLKATSDPVAIQTLGRVQVTLAKRSKRAASTTMEASP